MVEALKNYYLVKCFEKAEYRQGFNDGSNIHITGMGSFFDSESDFQRDTEGLVVEQPENASGYVFAAPANMKELLQGKGYLIDQGNKHLTVRNDRKNDLIDYFKEKALLLAKTQSFRLTVNGYICCFYLLPKGHVHFLEREINFIDENKKSDFLQFLMNYTGEKENHKDVAYISVYDAFEFMEKMYNGMKEKGYEISFAPVEYETITEKKRIDWFTSGNIEKLVFTKDKKFQYQHEFRIFLCKAKEATRKFIEESGIDFQKTIVKEFDYISPQYAKKLMENKT